jgi:hypothetical protein
VTILQLLEKAAGAGASLILLLEEIARKMPDLAPAAHEWIKLLNSAATQANLIALAEALPRELANIGQGIIQPKDHPSDAI